MRLLRRKSKNDFELTLFTDETPPYAILSHTWADGEVTYDEVVSRTWKKKAGYNKIRSCGERAAADNLQYFWVDTCCIDKTSSAELSEAINSMYKWYSKAKVCYAFLEDLEIDQTSDSFLQDLRRCKWFTRGWTLQELIAPKRLIFFNKDWDEVGDKSSLISSLIEITGIDYWTLDGPLPIQQLSVANRMSWASRRKTTRPEDEAYCLLGIFGINMALLYGEGRERAFLRLQAEILRETEDQSIFAWSQTEVCGIETKTKHWGLFAPTPSLFMNSSQYIPIRNSERSGDITISHKDITLKVAINSEESIIALNCREKEAFGFFCVPVARLRTGRNHYARRDYPWPSTVPEDIWKTFKHVEIKVPINGHNFDFLMGNLINYITFIALPSELHLVDFYPMWGYDNSAMTLRIEPFTSSWQGGGSVFLFRQPNTNFPGFLLCLFVNDERKGSENLGRHFVGVFDNSNRKSPRQFYYEDFAPWFHDRRDLVLTNAATLVEHDGITAWRLNDGTLVRVTILEDYDHPSLDSLAVAKILTGKSFREVSD